MTTLQESFAALLLDQHLADSGLLQNYAAVYLPLAEQLVQWQQQLGQCVIGINGAQGSGKSTLSKILALLLQQGFAKSVVVLSLDDFYLTKAQRNHLAESVHPLLQTRGVPGTHDVMLAMQVLTALKAGTAIRLPRFDKSQDDRVAESYWPFIDLEFRDRPVDIILFEGWCVAAQPQPTDQLQQPVNRLEAEEDTQMIWRSYVNQQLTTPYQTLFAQLDKLIMLQVPSFEYVYRWRESQERCLPKGMNAQQLQRFILHYERLTKYMLQEMPARADKVLVLGEDHQIVV